MSQEQILFKKALQDVNTNLKVAGLQFIEDNNDEKIFKRLRNRPFLCFAFIWFNIDVVAEIAWFVNGAMTGKSLVELTYSAPCITQSSLANIKMYFFLKNEPCVNDLINSLRKLQSITARGQVRGEVDKELERRMSFLTRVTKIQFWLNIISICGFAIVPFVTIALTYSSTGEIELVMPFVVLYPFNIYDRRIWPFMYFRQVWAGIISVFMVFGPDSFYYMCSAFIQIQFRYLHYDLERLLSSNPGERKLYNQNEMFRNDFTKCIGRHLELIRCVNLMERIYSKSTLFNVVTSSILICLTGFNITAMESWPLMIPFLAFVFLASGQIFIFCYYGDIVMRSSMAISDAVYNSQWYNADVKVMKDLKFVLTRAQKPCKLTAYGFSDINLRTFTRILSTSWSYFALLSTVNK